MKQYLFDQEKQIIPTQTVKNALYKLRSVFPEKNITITILKQTEAYTITQCTDKNITTKGKAHTINQAKASAIMEFVERLSWAEFSKNKKMKIASFNAFHRNLKLTGLQNAFKILHSNEQEKLEKTIKDTPIYWTKAYSLKNNKETWHPYGYSEFYNASTGIAAGNNKNEAILQALCEVIERHLVSSFFYQIKLKQKTTIINKKSIKDSVINNIIKKLNIRYHIDIILLSNKDIEVPTFMIRGYDPLYLHWSIKQGLGFGTHPNPRIALIRALTEFMQGRTIIKEQKIPFYAKSKEAFQHIVPVNLKPKIKASNTINFNDIKSFSKQNFKDEITEIINNISSSCDDIQLINLTHPKLNIPVFRVYIPNFYPGNIIFSENKNEYWLINKLIKISRQKKNNFYKNNFFKMLNVSKNLIQMKHPSINPEQLTPENCPFKTFTKLIKS